MISYSKPIIVIAGPTGSGKSDIAIQLAKDINGEIINADSRQIYKEISIGTAKPTKEEMQGIKHHLYDHISIKERYNIYQYQQDTQKILDSFPSEKFPILVGGTGLYIDSVIFNYDLQEDKVDLKQREKLLKEDIAQLQTRIDKKILDRLSDSDRNNPVRLVRIIERGSVSYSKKNTLRHIYFVIDLEKEKLKKRIKKRVDMMFDNGLLEENIRIREEFLGDYPNLKIIGYQEFDEYFLDKKSLQEVKNEIIKNTMRYAKRQRTWFKRHSHAIWSSNYNYILEEVLKFIKTS